MFWPSWPAHISICVLTKIRAEPPPPPPPPLMKVHENDNENDNIPPIMIGPTEIKHVSEIKFLGVVTDEKLSWDAHVKSLT